MILFNCDLCRVPGYTVVTTNGDAVCGDCVDKMNERIAELELECKTHMQTIKVAVDKCAELEKEVAYWKERHDIERGEVEPLQAENKRLRELLASVVEYIEEITLTLEDGGRWNAYKYYVDLREYGNEENLQEAIKILKETE